jgi:hypothetical protein
LIATYHMKGEAICVSRGVERDRVVDETGGQTVVFGRRGPRPSRKLSVLATSCRALPSSRLTAEINTVGRGDTVENRLAGLLLGDKRRMKGAFVRKAEMISAPNLLATKCRRVRR